MRTVTNEGTERDRLRQLTLRAVLTPHVTTERVYGKRRPPQDLYETSSTVFSHVDKDQDDRVLRGLRSAVIDQSPEVIPAQ